MAMKKNPMPRKLSFENLWAYDPSPETALAGIANHYRLFIGGECIAPKSKIRLSRQKKWF